MALTNDLVFSLAKQVEQLTAEVRDMRKNGQ